jgi:hypothetical protein
MEYDLSFPVHTIPLLNSILGQMIPAHSCKPLKYILILTCVFSEEGFVCFSKKNTPIILHLNRIYVEGTFVRVHCIPQKRSGLGWPK